MAILLDAYISSFSYIQTMHAVTDIAFQIHHLLHPPKNMIEVQVELMSRV